MIEYTTEEYLHDGTEIKFVVQIEPAPKLRYRWPHIFQVSRWWYEISYWDPGFVWPECDPEVKGAWVTFAYEKGGSGGAFTLRKCMMKASDKLNGFAHTVMLQKEKENKSE